ncbi:MAG: class I SAM-dependent methyltransferase [Syntrophales bacterium]|jgi:hypothetical protein|nr:class I SAM-dependent methyltransferase [Syntrophales bacterium]MDD4338256.1 class I SAM-dependent methyltransferase [Syntrophales bacterium]HOG06889.1 class I SAM-dependent methyltransferase [Syntrophales bacterium]HOS78354.1 class I SAM-dependent methyltransferase [Syntrophales bacterium]HPB71050.1 class I SAM-dependent methyltransferase [Syntrophales bacterium]
MVFPEIKALNIKGFLADAESAQLYKRASLAAKRGPCLEIGSYCGLSTAYLGTGCREAGGVLFSIDHHGGSEEQQPGQAYFDPDLVNPSTGEIDTFPHFRRTLRSLDLENTVIPIAARSELVARHWSTPLSLVFIDGGHTFQTALTDYVCWSPHLMPGGYLLIHDIFPDPSQGGQAPFCIYRLALASGLYEDCGIVGTLAILQRPLGKDLTAAAISQWQALQAAGTAKASDH